MKNFLKILVLVFLPFLFLTCTTDSDDPADPVDPDPINVGELLWTFNIGVEGKHSSGDPAIAADGTIYITSAGDLVSWKPAKICAINPDGTLKWKSGEIDHVGTGKICVGSDGTIYVVGYTTLYAINPADGSFKWQMQPHAYQISYLTIGNDGTLFVATVGTGSYRRAVVAITSEGQLKWIKDPAGFGSPYAHHLTVGKDGTLYTYWPIWSDVLGRYVRMIQALDPETGIQIWATEEMPLDFSDPRGMAIAEDGNIILSIDKGQISDSNRLLKINASTGAILWNKEAITGFPSIAPNGDILIFGFNAGLYCYSPSGDERWSAGNNLSGIHGITIDSEGKIYVAGGESTYGGNNQCFNTDGSLAWATYLEINGAECPAIANDGIIYIIGNGDKLYAVQGDKPLATNGWPRANYNNSNSRNASY